MFKKLALIVGVLLAIAAVVIATRPSQYTVVRSLLINAPVETAYGFVFDFHKWSTWSPWDHLDPTMQRTYRGAPAGVGAIYEWVGNDQVGSGRMTIADAKPPTAIGITLEFLKPFESTARTEFQFEVTPEGTKVSWKMIGENNFVGKFFSLVVNMEQMIGGDFERGLQALKVATEAADRATPTPSVEANHPSADAGM